MSISVADFDHGFYPIQCRVVCFFYNRLLPDVKASTLSKQRILGDVHSEDCRIVNAPLECKINSVMYLQSY